MATFESITGDLYVVPFEESDNYQNVENVYRFAIFSTDIYNIRFSGMNGFPVKEDHFNEDTYYPYYNETKATLEFKMEEDAELYREDVEITRANCNDTVFIQTDSEITAYSGNYITVDENVYKIYNSLLFKSDGKSEPDRFLDIEEIEEPIPVENIETENRKPIPYESVEEVLKNDKKNGMIKLQVKDCTNILY